MLEGRFAELENKIAGLGIGPSMFPHCFSSLDSVSVKNSLLKVSAEKERKELEANHTIKLLQREAIEIWMELGKFLNSFLILSTLSLLLGRGFSLVASVEGLLNVFGVEETPQEKHKVIWLWHRWSLGLVVCWFLTEVRSQLRVLFLYVLDQAMSEIIDTLVSLSLNEECVSVKIFAKELSHIPYNSFIEDVAP